MFAGPVAVWYLNSLWRCTLNLRGKRNVWVLVSMGQLWSRGAFPFPSAPLTAWHIVNINAAQAMDHTSLDPSFPRQLLSGSTGLLPRSFLPSGVPSLPLRSLTCDQILWLEPLPFVIHTCPLVSASTGISCSSALEGKAWPNTKESAERNINSSGVEGKVSTQTERSAKEVLSATTLSLIYILMG